MLDFQLHALRHLRLFKSACIGICYGILTGVDDKSATSTTRLLIDYATYRTSASCLSACLQFFGSWSSTYDPPQSHMYMSIFKQRFADHVARHKANGNLPQMYAAIMRSYTTRENAEHEVKHKIYIKNVLAFQRVICAKQEACRLSIGIYVPRMWQGR